jgi:hypothetical protein
MVYKNVSVNRTKTGEPPIFLGPMLLHTSSNYMSFFTFFSHIYGRLNKLQSILIGSDDEEALVKAISDGFRGTCIGRHILCTHHLETNTSDYLKDKVGLSLKDCKHICEDIFGDMGIINAEE